MWELLHFITNLWKDCNRFFLRLWDKLQIPALIGFQPKDFPFKSSASILMKNEQTLTCKAPITHIFNENRPHLKRCDSNFKRTTCFKMLFHYKTTYKVFSLKSL
ncbi:hypothetical protein DQM68_00500 [Leptospira mayottensis]|uniref:Uncharacterized protein n=1 Tax=Leptospira mayottensis TaxID=1137606 RepID=A0ABM6Y8K3_9LEPT|nr:hypothetical protein DQM68_00500 [Leptospira mayottensis]AXR63208.1 hypothetical protein DQM28_02125 [Leptospira mayottensis]AZQ01260.1 hypothetical protein LEP1GSC190_03495 [Leptospira mayottensis 200901116]